MSKASSGSEHFLSAVFFHCNPSDRTISFASQWGLRYDKFYFKSLAHLFWSSLSPCNFSFCFCSPLAATLRAILLWLSATSIASAFLPLFYSSVRSYLFSFSNRYFVLQGKVISYYADEKDNRPRRTIDLSHCIVRSEGTKKGGAYHVFGVYLASGVRHSYVLLVYIHSITTCNR